MEDARIVDLYWARSETAINETSAKYGKYCYTIATRTSSPTTSAFGRLTVKAKRLLSVPKPHWTSLLRAVASKAALLHTAMTL